jgi:hypothetical protein
MKDFTYKNWLYKYESYYMIGRLEHFDFDKKTFTKLSVIMFKFFKNVQKVSLLMTRNL